MRQLAGAVEPEGRLVAGRYRVESMLGQGGMGAVYAAVDTTTGKRIALKTTASHASATVIELFKREYLTLHGLRHPNIVEVYDYGIDEMPYYTMELLEGSDLSRSAPLPWQQVCSYLRQVATLLGLLHARRLLHRDITPRNLWVLPDGMLKMIDFGALSPFGLPTEVVGTPPFIAPEWLEPREAQLRVDQRSDLYALGALAYWLLTSAHAYSARSIRELPSAWARAPAPPSSLARLATDGSLPPIPAELDTLVLSLLHSEPAGRPQSTEVLIERIDAIAGPSPHHNVDHAVRGYVRSKVFVGRARERRQIGVRVQREQGGVFVIEGPEGAGRSRLLEQLALEAGLAGASRVLVRADAQQRSHGLANRLALGLLTALPREALAAAQPHAAVLAQLSPEAQEQLGVPGPFVRDVSPRGREQLQRALTEWIFALSSTRRLMLLIDDLESSDEESAALVASFAAHCSERRLLLVAALRRSPGQELPLQLQMFRDAAQCHALPPLTAAEVSELLRSVFGPAIYLERISDAVHRAAQGNPAHCLELVEYLVERGLARYSEGAWILPGQLSERELPPTRSEMYLARLAGLGAHARRLAESLSVHDGQLTAADCRAISELSEPDTAPALVELTLCGVLVESETGYRFSHVSVREQLSEALTPARRTLAHIRLAASLLAAARDSVDRLGAVLHFYQAGDVTQTDRLVREFGKEILKGSVTRLHVAVPLLEHLVSLYRAAGRDRDALAVPLMALSFASYHVDRRLADRYGLETIETLEAMIHFERARRWRRFLGRRLALLVMIIAASVVRRRRRDAIQVIQVLQMLAAVAIALNGVATSGMDLEMTARCRLSLEPFEGTGERAIIGVVRRTVNAVSSILSDAPAATHAKLHALIAELESDKRIVGLNPIVRKEFLGGCLMIFGMMESWRQSPAALAVADRLEPLGPMHALNADQLRFMFYSLRGGEPLKAEHYRLRVETEALQAGAGWQIVAVGAIGLSFGALWNHDAALAKRGAAELARLSNQLPSFRYEAQRARATYLVLTGRYSEAIALLSTSDEPKSAGWLRGCGILARAYNRNGQHTLAKEICLRALDGKSEEDLSFTLMTLHTQIELALADAALSNFEAARKLADQLLVRHADNGAIALGTLHELRARVALIEGDFATCREHCAIMRTLFALTEFTTLRELSERLWERMLEAERGEAPQAATPAALLADDAHLMTRMRLILSHTERSFERRARVGLKLAFELTGAETGFVIARGPTRVTAADERPIDPELVRWAEAQLAQPGHVATERTLGETALYSAAEHRYCVIRLSPEIAAPALVLGFGAGQPRAPSADVLATLARHLAEATETERPNALQLEDTEDTEDTRLEPSQ